MRIWKEEVGWRACCMALAFPSPMLGSLAAPQRVPLLSAYASIARHAVSLPPHIHITPAASQIFGPVLAARTFASEAEAIQLANSTEFGLGAGVISADEARCRLARRGWAGRAGWGGAGRGGAEQGRVGQGGRGAVAHETSEASGLQLANTHADLPCSARRVVEALECGLCWVNCSQPCFVQAVRAGSRWLSD